MQEGGSRRSSIVEGKFVNMQEGGSGRSGIAEGKFVNLQEGGSGRSSIAEVEVCELAGRWFRAEKYCRDGSFWGPDMEPVFCMFIFMEEEYEKGRVADTVFCGAGGENPGESGDPEGDHE